MKKLLFILLLIVPVLTYGQTKSTVDTVVLKVIKAKSGEKVVFKNVANVSQTNYGDTIKTSFSGDSVKFYTNKSAFAFNKPFLIKGDLRTTDWIYSIGTGFGFYNLANSTGIYSDAYKRMRIAGGGSLVIDGNVGIGILSPSEKLDVVGNIKASGNIYTNGNIIAPKRYTDSIARFPYTKTFAVDSFIDWRSINVPDQEGSNFLWDAYGLYVKFGNNNLSQDSYLDAKSNRFVFGVSGNEILQNAYKLGLTNRGSFSSISNSTAGGFFELNRNVTVSESCDQNMLEILDNTTGTSTGNAIIYIKNGVLKFQVSNNGGIEIRTIGEGIILTSPDGTKRKKIILGNDGTLQLVTP
jgi:hypothetical protein